MDFMKMNLQFFADEEGVNDPEPAEPEVTEEEEPEEAETAEDEPEEPESEESEPATQTPDQNAIFASIRRKAEEEAQKRFEAQQAEVDRQYAERFKGIPNPETGAPILSARDYAEALAAQERVEARNQMQQAGIDPQMLDNLIQRNPIIQQAKEVTQKFNSIEAERQINDDYSQIIALDPDMNSADDIRNSDEFVQAVNYCSQHRGTRLADAWKIVSFDRLNSAKAQAAQQQAINQVKGKSHLTAGQAAADSNALQDIPPAEVSRWKEWFPGKTLKQLKEMYNASLH